MSVVQYIKEIRSMTRPVWSFRLGYQGHAMRCKILTKISQVFFLAEFIQVAQEIIELLWFLNR